MSTRTVRLNDHAESILARLRQRTGLSISSLLKNGLEAYAEKIEEKPARRPIDVYREIDFGPGDPSLAPARNAKREVLLKIKQKHGR